MNVRRVARQAALMGYAAHANGKTDRADSAFALAVSALGADESCAWRNIAPTRSEGLAFASQAFLQVGKRLVRRARFGRVAR